MTTEYVTSLARILQTGDDEKDAASLLDRLEAALHEQNRDPVQFLDRLRHAATQRTPFRIVHEIDIDNEVEHYVTQFAEDWEISTNNPVLRQGVRSAIENVAQNVDGMDPEGLADKMFDAVFDTLADPDMKEAMQRAEETRSTNRAENTTGADTASCDTPAPGPSRF